ncbi:hypothetical protein [Gracilimonas sp.]|uniref:hypothetical protein n=1 Tax=Gracilimonas sp. TaxID=1974203 RepID=UPI0032EB3616
MNIFAKHIDLSKKLNVSVLSNRATARTLYNKEIKKTLYPNVVIDFKDIEFASRSFLDELNSLLAEKRFSNIHKMNMNHQVSKMDKLVSNKSEIVREDFKQKKSEADLMTV